MSPFWDAETLILRARPDANGKLALYYFIRPVVSAPAGEVTPRKGD